MTDWRDLSPKDLITKVEEINKQLDSSPAAPWVNITNSPIESIWPSRHVVYNGASYMSLGYGNDRQSPWGRLPQVILLIRQDIANKLMREAENVDYNEIHKTLVATHEKDDPNWFAKSCWTDRYKTKEIGKPLMGPDWQPAPGFERI